MKTKSVHLKRWSSRNKILTENKNFLNNQNYVISKKIRSTYIQKYMKKSNSHILPPLILNIALFLILLIFTLKLPFVFILFPILFVLIVVLIYLIKAIVIKYKNIINSIKWINNKEIWYYIFRKKALWKTKAHFLLFKIKNYENKKTK
jgi:hypothetical protein